MLEDAADETGLVRCDLGLACQGRLTLAPKGAGDVSALYEPMRVHITRVLFNTIRAEWKVEGEWHKREGRLFELPLKLSPFGESVAKCLRDSDRSAWDHCRSITERLATFSTPEGKRLAADVEMRIVQLARNHSVVGQLTTKSEYREFLEKHSGSLSGDIAKERLTALIATERTAFDAAIATNSAGARSCRMDDALWRLIRAIP